MAQYKAKDSATQEDLSEPDDAGKEAKGDHPIGYCRPPVQHQFPPGKSGNPKGRPKGPSKTKIVEQIMNQKVTVRHGETDRALPLLGANLLAHAVKGAKGDVRSANLALKYAEKAGLLTDREDEPMPETIKLGDRHDHILIAPPNKTGPSDLLFERLDPDLLSCDEGIELSRLAEIIDLGGDFTALSTSDFERIKHIVNKGRGKNVTPQVMSLAGENL